jgi:ketosteroid isomerase-like protein
LADGKRGSGPERAELVLAAYGAYESGDRRALEELLSDDFTLSSPADADIGRATYFERLEPRVARRPQAEEPD